MRKSTSLPRWLAAAAIALAAAAPGLAQNPPAAPAAGASAANGPAASASAPAAAVPAAPAASGIQGQNIFDVKPDASDAPDYLQQSNAQRNRVQPGNNGPMWHAVGRGAEGYSSLPRSEAPEAGVLIQPFVQYPGARLTTAGEGWRQVRNIWLIPYGGALLLIVLGALAIFFFARGPIGLHEPETGRRIERFTPFERSAHWANAIAFVILAVSGMTMAFGKFILLPVIGTTLFGLLTYALKTLHNFVGPLFIVSLVVVFVTFLRDNWPQRGDLHWLARGGGLFSKKGEPPSNRFNAGEKAIFWIGVFLLGIVVASSGLVLDKLIPDLVYDRRTMQIAHMVHNVGTVLMIAVFFFHIYLGTIGMRGAYTAMREGYVDETWAREHHKYWYDDIAAGKIPAQRSSPPGTPVVEPARPA
jgi:formate dehydrogenase subunit gamma